MTRQDADVPGAADDGRDRIPVDRRPQVQRAGSRGVRPPRTYVTGRPTRWIRIGAIVVTLLATAWALSAYARLPEIVPTHFDARGRPDAMGHKSELLVFFGIFAPMVLGMSWLSRYPRTFNYPGEVTERNAQQLYRLGEQTLVWMCACLTAMYLGIGYAILYNPGASPFVGLPATAALLGVCGVGIARMLRAA